MVEVMKIMSSFNMSMHTLLHSVPPTLQQAIADPCLSPGHSWASLSQSLVGSLFLSSGSWCTQNSVCALQESLSPVLCKFWWLYGGLMATSSKRAYAMPRSAAPRAPAGVHCRPGPPQETLTHSSVSVSVGSLGPGALV